MNWRTLITEEMAHRGDSWENVVSVAASASLDDEFVNGHSEVWDCRFTVWTHHYAYFPAIYDGMGWAASVSRTPDGIPTSHVGGG